MSSRYVDVIVHDGEVVTSKDVTRTSIAVKDGRDRGARAEGAAAGGGAVH